MTLKATLLTLVALGAGTGIGWTLHGTAEAPQTTLASSPSSTQASTALPSFASASRIDIEQLRMVVREELLAAQANGSTRSASAPPAVKPPAATPKLFAQREAVIDEVEQMISAGEWGNHQRATFHQSMAMLDPEQAQRLLKQVMIAFNQGGLRVTTDGPPL